MKDQAIKRSCSSEAESLEANWFAAGLHKLFAKFLQAELTDYAVL